MGRMSTPRVRVLIPFLLWLAVTVAGCIVIGQGTLEQARAAFDGDARAAHRALSEQARRQETLLATLALLQPAAGEGRAGAEQRLANLYPDVVRVQRRDPVSGWNGPQREALAAAEALSRSGAGSVPPAVIDWPAGRYWIVRWAEPTSFAVQIDLKRLLPDREVALIGEGPTRVWIEQTASERVLLGGSGRADEASTWQFQFRQRLAADSLPFDFVATRGFSWLSLPLSSMLAWALGAACLAFWLHGWWARRAQLAELPAGSEWRRRDGVPASWPDPVAWQGGEPRLVPGGPTTRWSTAVEPEPPELVVARGAIDQAARRSRHAVELIGRMQAAAAEPGLDGHLQAVAWEDALRDLLELQAPELERLGAVVTLSVPAEVSLVDAEPVALDRVFHGLFSAVLKNLTHVPVSERQIELTAAALGEWASLTIRDTGPGWTDTELERLLLPADPDAPGREGPFSLPVCAALAHGMGGSLIAGNGALRGAWFRLSLPIHR